MESENAFQLYQNSGYRNDRQKKQTLILDLQDHSEAAHQSTFNTGNVTFSVNLQEPFIIDALCDVYLDNMSTFDAKENTWHYLAQCLDLHESWVCANFH